MARARLPLALIALAAMLGSHWLAYVFAAPDPHARADLLSSTGHGYWPTAAGFAVAAIVVGLGSFIAQRLAPEARTTKGEIFANALPRFLAVQIGGFTALEIVERLASGHAISMRDLFATTFVVGIAIQAIAALLSALFLVLVATVVARFLAVGVRPQNTAGASLPLVSLVPAPRLVPATGAHTLRGPPARA